MGLGKGVEGGGRERGGWLVCLQRQTADLFSFKMSRAGSVTLTQKEREREGEWGRGCGGEFLERCGNKVSKRYNF